MNRTETRKELLTLAQDLLQRRGASGFSFQDLADRLKIRKASIHYHFRTKNELFKSLLDEYLASFQAWAHDIETETAPKKWGAYVKIFRSFVRDNGKICPGGALALEDAALPAALRKQLKELQNTHRVWLESLIEQARRESYFRAPIPPRTGALLIGSVVQGALQIARLHERPALYDEAMAELESLLKSPGKRR